MGPSLTATALLRQTGTIRFILPKVSGAVQLYSLECGSFCFALMACEKYIELVRGEKTLKVPLKWRREKSGGFSDIVHIVWGLGELSLYTSDSKASCVLGRSDWIPQELVDFAAKKNLTPEVWYKDNVSVCRSIMDYLDLKAGGLRSRNTVNPFWNRGDKSKAKDLSEPKGETDVQPLIREWFHDLFEQRGINLIPEYPVGAGNVDFLFRSPVDGGSICMEIKNAHSSRLVHGLTVQLPAYMNAARAEYGIYLVLSYGDDYPSKINENNIPNGFKGGDPQNLRYLINDQFDGRIFVRVVDVSWGVPPSKAV